MKRFLIFTVLFPPLAWAVFNTPDFFKNRFVLDWWGVPLSYCVATIPAWLTAGVDSKLSAKPAYLRILGTTVAGAVITESIALFMWGFFPDYWPVLMAGLVGAIPAAVCSLLSKQNQRAS
jgi:uncharacterized membrane protein YcfT